MIPKPAPIRRPLLSAALTLVLTLLVCAAPSVARAHGGPAVIIDTDMAADDARALALLLSSPHCHVLGVVTSDGVSAPDLAATNVCRLLGFLNITDVPVGIGRSLGKPAPAFRENATRLDWGQLGAPALPRSGLTTAPKFLAEAFQDSTNEVYYLCLGPLSNLADALKADPAAARAIRMVLWYGAPLNTAQACWNGSRDEAAWKTVAQSGLRVEVVRWADAATAPAIDDTLLDELATFETPAAEAIVALHSSGRGAELVKARHFRLWDDLLAAHFLEPTRAATAVPGHPGWSEVVFANGPETRQQLVSLLRSTPARGTVIMADFPTEPAQLLPDLAALAPRIIAHHGREEWKAAVLTSELHRHLGTYSIVGAKMGLRARELFNVALDELRVESHAGLEPPLSCVNDGLQVATGASLGRGTISVPTNAPPACEAVFRHGNRVVRLKLRPELSRQIAGDMARLVQRHGGLSPAYFQDVRAVSLQHWLNFDRGTIFEETLEGFAPKD